MALIVETGANVAGADSYATRAAYIDYALAWYNETVADTVAADAPMRRATAYLNGLAWKGTRTYGRSQPLAWPRSDVTDCEGLTIGSGEIPTDLINAQHELARAEFTSPGVLSPSVSKSKATVTREKVDVLEREYDTDNLTGSIDEARTIVTAAMDRLKCYLVASPTGGFRFVAAVV